MFSSLQLYFKNAVIQRFPVDYAKFLKTSFYRVPPAFVTLPLRKKNCSKIYAVKARIRALTLPVFTCSKLTIETLEQGVKYVQVNNKTPERRLVLVFLLLTLSR